MDHNGKQKIEYDDSVLFLASLIVTQLQLCEEKSVNQLNALQQSTNNK